MIDLNNHKNILVATSTVVRPKENSKSYEMMVAFDLSFVPHDFDLSSLNHSMQNNYWLMDGLKARLLYFSEFGEEGSEREILEFLKNKIMLKMRK